MKRLLALTYIFCACFCYAQTWTEREEEKDIEYTVISVDQFERLIEQYEASHSACIITYTDVLEYIDYKVIAGTRPNFTDYYCLLGKTKITTQMTDEQKSVYSLLNPSNIIVCGHPNTGKMSMIYTSALGAIYPNAVEIQSEDYPNKIKQYLDFVTKE